MRLYPKTPTRKSTAVPPVTLRLAQREILKINSESIGKQNFRDLHEYNLYSQQPPGV